MGYKRSCNVISECWDKIGPTKRVAHRLHWEKIAIKLEIKNTKLEAPLSHNFQIDFTISPEIRKTPLTSVVYCLSKEIFIKERVG